MTPDDPTPRANDAGETYQALYRRYRPQRFGDVRGQEHVTRALRNAVREERVAHAYLFSGPRGTGKTSTARILAMALNCDAPVDGEPDGTCRSCMAVRSGSSMDVFELDAASNRKLDEMRDLLSRVALGTPGRWKVYIVDEVHQLTPDAASALLKTLEEPPSHVVFVLATTDPQKVLPTIQSRTQHFEFHLLDGDVLAGLLGDINRDANLGLPTDMVRLAVQKGRGSARDAESALEQLAAAGGEPEDAAPIVALAAALAERDVGGVLQAVARAIANGRDPRRLGSDLVEHLREAFLANQAPSLVLLPAAETALLAEEAGRLGLPLLVRSMEAIGQALVDMRDSVDPRVTLEVALVRLASPAVDASPAGLLERVERLERAFAEASGPAVAQRPAPPMGATPSPRAAAPSWGRAGAALSEPPPYDEAPRASSSPPSPPSAPSSSPPPVTPPPVTPPPVTPPPVTPPPVTPPGPANPAEARAALGAYLRGTPKAATPPAPQPSQNVGEQAPPGGGRSLGPAQMGVPAPEPGMPPSPEVAGTIGGSGASSHAPAPRSGPALPTRDELTKAWGDTVLGSLGRPAQAYLGQGHFTEVGDAAVFALPDLSWVTRASKFAAEAEAALAKYFGRPVPLRIVLDEQAAPPSHEPAGPVPEEDAYDLDELTEAPAVAEVSAEQRILDIFPGAVVES